MASRINWLGSAVTAKLRRAQIAGINEIMSKAATGAKSRHAWKNRTGVLEGSIDVVQFARAAGRGVHGVWGSRDVRYALIHELGGIITPKTARALFIRDQAGEISAVVASVTIPPRPYLRPAADLHYPDLAKTIRKHFERGSK